MQLVFQAADTILTSLSHVVEESNKRALSFSRLSHGSQQQTKTWHDIYISMFENGFWEKQQNNFTWWRKLWSDSHVLEEQKIQRLADTQDCSHQKINCSLHMQMYSQVSSVPGGLEYDLLSSYIEVNDRPPLTVLAYTHWWKSHGFWVGQSPHQLLISSTE